MLSKNKIKLINSLHKKKGREANAQFIAEGHKLVSELLQSDLKCYTLIALDSWFEEQNNLVTEQLSATESELQQVTQLTTHQRVIGVFQMPTPELSEIAFDNELVLFLDEIQDPGNLGTIIRQADWFGVRTIVCNKGTVDVFSHKVVQATMGAIAGVAVHYTTAANFFQEVVPEGTPIYGTFMNGVSVYEAPLSISGVVVLGNEGNGISKLVTEFITERITIPSFNVQKRSESLNVATASSIVCSEFKRRI